MQRRAQRFQMLAADLNDRSIIIGNVIYILLYVSLQQRWSYVIPGEEEKMRHYVCAFDEDKMDGRKDINNCRCFVRYYVCAFDEDKMDDRKDI